VKYFLLYIEIVEFHYKNNTKNLTEKVHLTNEENSNFLNSIIRKYSSYYDYYDKRRNNSRIIVVDNIWSLYKLLFQILSLNISLRIAIGCKEYNESKSNLRNRNIWKDIIEIIKNDILYSFTMEKGNNNNLNNNSFAIITQDIYELCGSEKICINNEYISREGVYYYLIDFIKLEKANKILTFFEFLHIERDDVLDIETLYCEPLNYPKIKRNLEKNSIVILKGIEGIGTSYTAIKMMLDFSEKYLPRYIPHVKQRNHYMYHSLYIENPFRSVKRMSLRNALSKKTQGNYIGEIFYIENPWTMLKYGKKIDLYDEVEYLISITKEHNRKIILTLDEHVFTEYKNQKEKKEKIWSFLKKVQEPVRYNQDQLKKMFESYVKIYQPLWTNNSLSKNHPNDSVWKDFSTPLMMKCFFDYSSQLIEYNNHFNEKWMNNSMELTFSNHVIEKYLDECYREIVFYCFAFLRCKLRDLKTVFSNIFLEFGYTQHEISLMSIENILSEMEFIEHSKIWGIHFVHPSFWDGFYYLLSENGEITDFGQNIFFKIIDIIINDKENGRLLYWEIAFTLVECSSLFPEKVKEVLINLIKGDSSSGALPRAIIGNFNMTPEAVRRILLDDQTDRLFNEHLTKALIRNYSKLSEDFKVFFHKQIEKKEVQYLIPKDIIKHFDQFSPDEGKEIILKFVDNDQFLEDIGWSLADNFHRIPKDLREHLINTLISYKNAIPGICWAIISHYSQIPEDIKDHFIELLQTKEFDKDIAKSIFYNFDFINDKLRMIFFDLIKTEETAYEISSAPVVH